MANESNAAVIKWFKPVIEALKALGGSGERKAVQNWIIEHKNDNEVVNPKDVDFARNHLRAGGYIDGPERGLWSLTEKGKSVDMTPDLASKILRDSRKATKAQKNAQVEEEHRYWWLNANPKKWRFSELAVGGTEYYDFKSKNGKKRSNFSAAEVGDSVIVYASDEVKKVVGIACVSEKRDGDKLFFKKVERLDNPISKADLEKENPGLQNKFKQQSSLVKLNKDEYEFIIGMIRKENPEKPKESDKTYDEKKFLEEVFMDKEQYETLVGLVRNKKNVILQGAPGVGKTFAAKRLAYSMMGVEDPNRVMMVQFHQSYSYEDFIMGFRPSETSFELKRGAFYNFCKAAEIDSENEYFFIIDEINRGNLSKIFGELFMLIESDKRGVELQLLYSDEKFSVPNNVYIIGMMNTADRSLAMLDYALRRRFAFFEMKPGFDTEGFRAYRMGLASEKFDRLINCVESMNTEIAADESLGEGFCIGHSYFCNLKKTTDQALSGIVEYELIPLLKEYWFDEPSKVKYWTNNLRSAIK